MSHAGCDYDHPQLPPSAVVTGRHASMGGKVVEVVRYVVRRRGRCAIVRDAWGGTATVRLDLIEVQP